MHGKTCRASSGHETHDGVEACCTEDDELPSSQNNTPYPPGTHILRLSVPKTLLLKAFGLF